MCCRPPAGKRHGSGALPEPQAYGGRCRRSRLPSLISSERCALRLHFCTGICSITQSTRYEVFLLDPCVIFVVHLVDPAFCRNTIHFGGRLRPISWPGARAFQSTSSRIYLGVGSFASASDGHGQVTERYADGDDLVFWSGLFSRFCACYSCIFCRTLMDHIRWWCVIFLFK